MWGKLKGKAGSIAGIVLGVVGVVSSPDFLAVLPSKAAAVVTLVGTVVAAVARSSPGTADARCCN